MKAPKRLRDTRVVVIGSVGPAGEPWAKKGDILDGWIDRKGNFRRGSLTIHPSHFRVIGTFYFRKRAI